MTDQATPMSELLPCPFCGDIGIIIETGGYHKKFKPGFETFYGVQCGRKYTRDDCCQTARYFETKDEAIKKWNTRDQSLTAPLLEKIESRNELVQELRARIKVLEDGIETEARSIEMWEGSQVGESQIANKLRDIIAIKTPNPKEV